MRLGDDRHLGPGEPNTMIGTQVGSFTIVCPLGEGGRGSVYLAEHAVLRIRRAVKIFSPHLTRNALAVRRFVNEVRAAAGLHHRNLIQVHDVGQLATGAWFMALDYLDGGTLGRLMTGHVGPMPPDLIVHLVGQIANGLQVAHDHEIVHRDLTPENVFVIFREGDPHHVVLRDFGVARLAGDPIAWPETRSEPGDSGPASGQSVGTNAYMPPEQLRGGMVGPAADVFALGVITYQMSTGGWFPHQYGESRAGYSELPAAELHDRQLAGPPVDPRDRVPGLSAAWADVVLSAVSADPDRRPVSARAFALGLAEALPASRGSPGGLAIVRACARELIDAGAELETARVPRPSAPPAAHIGSRYQLGERLGAGGMAEVFSATMVGAEGFARRVAIKRVLSGLSRIPAFATMFVAEAQIASRLSHPNIVSVLDFARDSEDRLYLVMEYVDGRDLTSLLAAGPISPALAIFITVEVLRALGYAHDLPARADHGDLLGRADRSGQVDRADPAGRAERAELPDRAGPVDPAPASPTSGTTEVRGVIHRDVSPQNLLLSYEGAVKLSDFGLAKVRVASGGVRSDVVRGKPSYMSPEQVSGEPLDGRADLYAVGVMLWEMLAARPLFTGTAKEITAQVIFKDVARPSSFRSSVPADLEAVAMTLLAHDREDRFSTAQAAIEALLGCADAPLDGRGELVQLLAARFRAGAGARAPRRTAPEIAPRPEQVTVQAPPSLADAGSVIEGIARPRRGRFTTALCLAAIGGVAAAVLARGGAAQSQTTDRAAPPRSVALARAVPAQPAPEVARTLGAPADAGVGDAGPPTAAHAGDGAAPRPAPRRERVARLGRTGELAIIVRPWAMIWLNGKPSGQTPFRSAVPAGRYRVRLANDDVGHDEITTVMVEPGQTATVERSW